ncbi:purine-nucleoside phosphorylase [Marinicella litoralis]|uniref:Purine nucleoside phosphorylase n=1 Tax=Marinicella litoralis TaxID=644220 RepID=A0A4R6XYQ1_9GAMM|nr:purine-nucleoside phosphorylase [Marinicella litoralis]TDR23377.1 purine-nucleoside phosphorylase [Marinicella litoralis]
MENTTIKAVEMIRHQRVDYHAKVAMILGSGLGTVTDQTEILAEIPYSDIPGFPETGVAGHSGSMLLTKMNGHPLIILNGRIHFYEKGEAGAMAPVIATLKLLGIETLILTNAAGSLLNSAPGSVMLIKDYINFTGQSPLFGVNNNNRFVSMSKAYDAQYRYHLRQIAEKNDIHLAQGVYAWMVGPQFETPAEIRAIRMMGADAVGMSTVPETILARYHNMKVAALSIITNYGAGMDDVRLSHEQTLNYAPKAAAKVHTLISGFLDHLYATN